jgi:hypothetical protein
MLKYLQWACAVTGAAFSSARKLHRPENRGDLKIKPGSSTVGKLGPIKVRNPHQPSPNACLSWEPCVVDDQDFDRATPRHLQQLAVFQIERHRFGGAVVMGLSPRPS